MAAFSQHVAVSTAIGAAYGAVAYYGIGIEWPVCVIAAGLTSLAGMLPDLDSPNGHPVREVFGFAGAVVPLLMLRRCHCVIDSAAHAIHGEWIELSNEKLIVIMAASYLIVRYGFAWLLDRLSDHRGMFHSIPAALIAAIATFLLFDSPQPLERLYLAGGTTLGFLSHLVMDELWSVRFGFGVGLKKSAGTAFKLFSRSIVATTVTYAILLGACFLLLHDPALDTLLGASGRPELIDVADELRDAVRR